MAKTLEERKSAVLDQLMAIDAARRGQLSQQYYAGKSADGRSKKQGPYYVWQRYVKGQKRSVRVPRDQVARVEAEMERGGEVGVILDELWAVLEQSAQEQDQQSKKKPKRSRQHVSERPKPRSI
ncbi:MAG: DUF6788 family protein [Kiritimatiellia bacterium]